MEFSMPGSLECPTGGTTIVFNNYTGGSQIQGYYLTDISGNDSPSIRNPVDNRPQRDGPIVHRFFWGGRFPVLSGFIAAYDTATRQVYEDNLRGALNKILRTDGRFIYTPSGQSARFLTCRLYDQIQIGPSTTGAFFKEFQISLCASREPFVYTYTQHTDTVAAGGSVVLTNVGNAAAYPQIKVYSGTFTISNTTTGYSITLTAAPVGGGYAEILAYRQTIYLNGDSANLLPYMDLDSSDFFTIEPGANTITLTGSGHADILWNDGWV